MDVLKGILLKLASALLFAVMSALIRWLGEIVPLGQVVFFRSAFAILPVVMIYALRRELAGAVRTARPFGHFGRGLVGVAGMFLSFAALARLPLANATAIGFAAPLITVALAALVLKERVRIFRWSAVGVGFGGVLVMLIPYLDVQALGASGERTLGAVFALAGAFCNAGSVIQTRRLTDSETTSSIVLLFLADLCPRRAPDAAIRLAPADRKGAGGADRDRTDRRLLAHPADRELSVRTDVGGRAVRLYVDPLGLRARLRDVRRGALGTGLRRRGDHCARRPVRDLARASARPRAPPYSLGLTPHGCARRGHVGNALNVMMVRVSWMPGMTCTFSLTKWPISVPSST